MYYKISHKAYQNKYAINNESRKNDGWKNNFNKNE